MLKLPVPRFFAPSPRDSRSTSSMLGRQGLAIARMGVLVKRRAKLLWLLQAVKAPPLLPIRRPLQHMALNVLCPGNTRDTSIVCMLLLGSGMR